MFENERQKKASQRPKWAKAAGDRAVLSAAGNQETARYIEDLDLSMAENIRFKPAPAGGEKRLRSVRPSGGAAREERPKLSGEMELTTGKAEVGYDEKRHDMVFGFVRHENDSDGRTVQENKAASRTIHGQDRFYSNDEGFSQGAMELRCEAARTPKTVMRRLGTMYEREGGETTMDRVLPFQKVGKERARVRQLRQMEHESREGRTAIHSAASGVAAFAGRKRQKQAEFRKKFANAVSKARENRQTDDYQLFIRKKWQAMREESPLADLAGFLGREEDTNQWDQAPEPSVREHMPPSSKEPQAE